MKKFLSALLVLPAALSAGAALAPGGFYTDGGEVIVNTPRGEIRVLPTDDGLFRVRQVPAGTPVEFSLSQGVVADGVKADHRVWADASKVVVFTPTTSAHVDRVTGLVTFYDADGRLLLTEFEGIDNSTPGKRSVSFLRNPGPLYGGGERGHRPTVEGDSLTMYNRQNYGYTAGDPRISQMGISVPFITAGDGSGVFFDDFDNALLVTDNNHITYTSPVKNGLSYYFVNGDGNLAGATEKYTRLTGRQPLPPLWTLGYVTSKYGYHNEQEARGVVDSLISRGYPLDGMVLDLYWYGVETDMGRLEWDTVQWPDHAKMLSDLKDQGVNMVLISQPYINKKGAIDNYNLLSEKGMLVKDAEGKTHDVTTWVGDAGMFDVSNPATREWLWNRLKGLTADGVAGWWGDLGEPEVHPLTIVHDNGLTASEFHNAYGNEWSRLIYEGLRRDYPEMRPMLMMRGGTAGLQRYGVFPWTTDVSRSWGGFQPQVNLMLSSGISGLGYMGSDVGGFAVDRKKPYDPELYVRWLQFGTFSPMLRTHATYRPEPYHYPQQEEIIKRFIRMRYEWLPYNYTLAYENATHGWPLARPLNFRGDNSDKKFAEVSDEYLWGDNVLVAPVMTAGATSRKVLFPAGEWVDWNDPSRRYKGGSTATVKAPLSTLPLFVRAGSFIPQYDRPIQNVTEYNPQFLTIKYFPSAEKTEYTLFDDNRLSPTSLVDDEYQLINLCGNRSGNEIEISLSDNGGRYEGMPDFRMLTFEIPALAKSPAEVLIDDRAIEKAVSPKAIRQQGWTYDAATRTLTIRLTWTYTPTTIRIR